ncbi:hypothetical protein K437DRAFT_225471 [Tilletiaria anomala UBC 951]|uniref:Dipeptidyl-aminopeptidase B n=1 Tax=Tilletiaria anomala (strain ATCC 24038 / CBS 436.72 / UBC 951) TaxID=1037660 RepID=A0A066VQD7_TILAU|nr:uncharacterized protein K437DRAFT_225471 [Tilletiaria anomala UBC 951]KDN43691.1 hypothetical protein K437DRAFT_225471 [Tilletiaria anomala UBC 951]
MQPRSSSAKSEDEVDQRFIEALRTQSPKSSLRQLNMDMLFNGTLYARGADINWSEDDPDVGVFSYVDPATQDLIIQDVTHARKEKTGTGEVAKGGGKVTLVSGSDVKDKKGNRIQFDEYIISPDMRYVLFLSDRVKQWRYSSHYNVWLFDVAAKKAAAISADGVGKLSMPPTISNVKFAPSSAPRGSPARTPPSLAFVSQNDIYFLPSPDHAPVRITNSGATEIFNGVPDWVYEEEVFSSDSAMWFSPDGTKLAYLSFDERDVPTFDFPIYNPSHWFPAQTTPYTEKTKMKYPKPGYPNPVVSAHVVDVGDIKEISAEQGAPSYNQISAAKLELHSPDPLVSAFAMDLDVDNALAGSREKRSARLVTEVAWIGNSDLLLRESNRASDRARVLHFDLNKVRNVNSSSEAHLVGDVVRRISTVKENGWIEVAQTIRPLGNTGAYLEVMPTAQGYRQLALFASATSADPVFLTQGKWEIDGNIKHVDIERKRVYFIAAHPLPSERHLFYVALPDAKQLSTYRAQDPIPLTDTSTGGWNTVSFDPKGAYYLLSSQSPDDPPARRVIGVDDRAFNYVLEDNRALRRISAEYVMPTKLYYNITTPSGANISVSELRPHDFDASGRNSYPVLVNVYGGPNSQMVQQKWQRSDWHQYVACEMGYLVATIDGRGTGFKGRLNRNPVTTRLGDVESLDVTEAAHQLSRLPYVDERRIGIWGWSYGGYLTSKVIERDSGVFNLGMSVAPVTSWRFYDSIYTERYMKLPTDNMQGYEKSGLHATDGFKHSHFLIAQGSADDNVHFQNSAHLLDMLTGAKVRGFRFRMFTDSDHSISMRGAYQELHEYLLSFLSEKWGPGGKRRFRLKDT